jgi:hypothetical protein
MTKADTKQVELGSAFDLLFKSWELVKKNWQMFAVVNVAGILAALSEPLKEDNKTHAPYGASPFPGAENPANWDLGTSSGIAFVVSLLAFFIFLFFHAMATKLQMLAAQGKNPSLRELIDAGKKYWFRLFLLVLVLVIIVALGLVLFIVPGLIALSRLAFAPYVMVDKDLGVMETIRESNRLATGRAMAVWSAVGVIFLVGLIVVILNKIPLVGPVAGVVVAIAFSLILPLRYLQVKKIAG